jgi:basic membrane protein A
MWDTSYPLGVLAGLMTETDHVGGIAGFDFPTIVAEMEGYKAGARAVNPDVEVTIVYLGTFDDVSLGKEAALAQASAGADVIYHVADKAGLGVIEGCEEAGIWAIGFGLDQNPVAPETVISTCLYDSAEQYVLDVKAVLDGTWTGEVRLYSVGSGVTDVADFHGLVPDDIAEQVMEVRDQIANGEFQPPYITESTE